MTARAHRPLILAAILAAFAPLLRAQDAPLPAPPAAAPHGTVIFSRSADQDAAAAAAAAVETAVPNVTDAERDALTYTSYALDAKLTPADGSFAVRARLTLRNDSAVPLRHLALQISSSLHWETIELGNRPIFAGQWQQHQLATDADHTGAVTEAVISLPTPLAAGATADLTVLYSGSLVPSAERLQRIGAPDSVAASADWDAITSAFTGLRGFGDVLWYPATTPALFLGDGARLFQSIGRLKLRQAQSTFALRLTLLYTGVAPSGAILNGVAQPIAAVSNSDVDIPDDNVTPRTVTVDFAAAPLGFRAPSLFLVQPPPAPAPDKSLIAYTTHPELVAPYAAAAAQVMPLLNDWLGVPPPLLLVDLPDPADQPFETGALLATALHAAQPSELAPQMIHALARAQLSTAARPPRAWMDEGLAQFLTLLWMEQTLGRRAAVDEMNQHNAALALAEPAAPAAPLSDSAATAGIAAAGQSLILATDEIYYRTKAADVWWMLRDLVGDTALQRALAAYHQQSALEKEPSLFTRILEQAANKDLEWFFDDWVYSDHGLPDLSITAVVPRRLLGKDEYLVAVEVSNDGYAAAEVPVTVRAGAVSITQRLFVPARAHATTRILFGVPPESVQVNDGSVPEQRSTVHRQQIPPPDKSVK